VQKKTRKGPSILDRTVTAKYAGRVSSARVANAEQALSLSNNCSRKDSEVLWKEVQSPTLNQSTKRSDNRRDTSSATQGYIWCIRTVRSILTSWLPSVLAFLQAKMQTKVSITYRTFRNALSFPCCTTA